MKLNKACRYTFILIPLLALVPPTRAQDAPPALPAHSHAEADYVVLNTSNPTASGDTPWTVHEDQALIHTEPDAASPVVGILMPNESASGDVVYRQSTDEEWLRIKLDSTDFGFVSLTEVSRVHPANRVVGNLPIGKEIVERYWGIPIDYEASDLVDLPVSETDGRQQRLRKEAADALAAMFAAAHADGVDMIVGSSYRSGSTQKRIYDHAVKRSGRAQRYSAPPGHSEHQLGTTVDLSDPGKAHFLEQSFGKTPQGKWLRENAWKYGFVLTYPPDGQDTTRYIFEPWHFRYWGREKAAGIWHKRHGTEPATTDPSQHEEEAPPTQ